MKPSVRIIILNYNGAALLPQCLPSIFAASREASYPTQVTVLDNQSADQGLVYVRREFPSVSIERARENRVLCSYNDYLPHVQEPIVILLNNDIRVESDFVDPLVAAFGKDPLTFLVAPRVMDFDGSKIQAAQTKAALRFGFFWCSARYPGYEKEALRASETYSSGFGAFSRELFLKLGGYDARYLPGIFEDVDLCHRARLAGYHLYYEPKSVVYHWGQASFKQAFDDAEMKTHAYRNHFLFLWKNFKGISFWLAHLFFLPLRLILALVKGDFAMPKGFVRALRAAKTL